MAEPVPRRSLSLQGRVALAVGAVLLLGGAMVLIAAQAYGRQAAREAFDRLLIGAASDIAASITVRGGRPLVDMPVSAFELLALAADDRVRYRVVGPGGTTLTGDDTAPAPQDTGDLVFYDGSFAGEPARYVALTRRFAERSFSGPVRVIVGQTLRARGELSAGIARGAMTLLLAAGAAMALFAWLAVRSALAPLPRIGAALRARDPGDLTPIVARAPAEIAEMLGALNAFMARLERQANANARLIGDTAHQLRTPVAAIRAQAQLALRHPDPQEQGRIAGRIEARAAGLGALLDQLLSHALISHRSDTAPRPPLDLREIAVEALELVEDAHGPGAVRLELPDRSVMVRGDALSLAEALKNLLVNAARHGRPPIRLGVRDAPHCAYVSDAGNGPPEAVLRRPAERFAEGGAMRGSGLGLAIAHDVASAHGGALRLSKTDGGFEARLELPPA